MRLRSQRRSIAIADRPVVHEPGALRPPAPAGATATAPGDLASPGLLERGLPVVERVLKAVETHPRSPLPGFRLVSLTPGPSEVGTVLDAVLARDDRQIALRLSPTDDRVAGLVALPFVTLSYSPDTPLAGKDEEEGLIALARLVNRYLEAIARGPSSPPRARRAARGDTRSPERSQP